ncbi:hypothetical protein K5Q02_19745 [Pseudomonas sp. MM211]|uniref:hypothetical protein n=1 Tax=Pseudomonas sp. MM211 TaxID=2866808 RepID=UPI001CEC7811|nr:hypothetical protein [Pseudomonas sp. MM211]UCJ16025.1 hypothetical protein K5Q02_19745 [Pseudomonas sp. MM211]
MKEQLLLAKRLFLIGSGYAEKDDPVSAGISISLFQDSIEIFIWSLLKSLDAEAKEQTAFTSFFDLVKNAKGNTKGLSLPFKAKILELNKSRINFKHYGNLPDISEAKKFKAYTEEFLTISFYEFYSIELTSLSLADLIPYSNIRAKIKNAESLLESNELEQATAEISMAKAMLFEKISNYLPKPDRRISDGDKLLRKISGEKFISLFKPLTEYLDKSNEISIISLLGIQISDYFTLQRYLPAALKMSDGQYSLQYHDRLPPTKEITKSAINIITSAAIRAREVIGE